MTTKNKGHDEELKSQKKYRNLFENEVAGMYRSTLDGLGILDVNQALCDKLGYTREEILSNSANILWADSRARIEMVNQIKKHGSVFNYEADFVTKSGEIIQSLLSLKLYPQDGYIEGFAIDITERKRTENVFHLFKNLVEYSSDAIGMSTPEGKHYYQNEAFDRMFGDIGDCPAETVYVDKEIGKHVFDTIMGGGSWQGEVRMFKKDGTILDIFQRAYAIRNQVGHIIGLVGLHTDITERKQSEEALLQSEAKYRFLTERINDIVWTTDLDFNVTYDSPVIKRILGYTAQERVGQKIIALLTPESYAQALEVLSAELKRDHDEGTDPDRSIKLELECYHKNGSTVWMECTVSAIRDDSGKIIGFHGVSRDISDRKRADAALKESEERFRSLIQKSLDLIILLDEKGYVIYETPSLEILLGYQSGSFIGKTPLELIHPDDLERVTSALNEVYLKSNPGIPTEFRFRKSDGTWVYLEAIGQNLLEDPAIKGIVITARDITERKRSEDILRASEAKYRRLYENITDAFVTVDMTGRFKEYNQSYIRMLGYSAEELKYLTYKDFTPEKWHAIEDAVVQEQVLLRGYSDLYEKEYRRKDGTIFPIELRTILIRDDDTGKPLGMWAIVRDISSRKRIERELKTHRDHLEDLVRERTSDLKNTYEQLKEENDNRKVVESELNLRKHELEEMNSALHVLLKQREEDKANMEMNIISNIKTSVLPYFEQLEASGIGEDQMRIISMIKSLLGEITSSFIRKISSEFLGFTPNEIKIASLIKEGKSSKKIAEILNISLNTVHTYRYKIRIKTGLKNNKVNLRSYLQTLG